MRLTSVTPDTAELPEVQETTTVEGRKWSLPSWRHLRRPVPSSRIAPDLVIVATLVVVAFLVRRHGLPTHGLWLDDAEEGAALRASLGQLLSVGFDHAGFISMLMGWTRLTGSSALSLAIPALIAGSVAPGILYLALRRLGYARSIGALLGAALLASGTDIVYSGRVKTYTIDVLIVLTLLLIVPRLARIRWHWQTGVLWVVAALAVATFSGFTFIAVAAAAGVLLLHPASDLRVRLVALAVQGVAQTGYLIAVGRTYNASAFNRVWRQTWDAFIDFHLNPVRFGSEVVRHVDRVAQAFPGGSGWVATLAALAALAGLLFAAWRSPQAIRARYALLILTFAFVGALLGRFPFGPRIASQTSNGERASLWLLPVIALGLAIALHYLRLAIAEYSGWHLGFDVAAYAATVTVLVFAVARTALPYPYPGASQAVGYIESNLGPHDAVLVPWPAQYSFATESNVAGGVQARPSYSVGFWPRFDDARIHLTGTSLRVSEVVPSVTDADRVFVYRPDPFNRVEAESVATYESTLRSLHFAFQRRSTFGAATVEVWQGHPGVNLRLSDFPRGWHVSSEAADQFSNVLFACLHTPRPQTVDSIRATGASTAGRPFVTSEMTSWPFPTAAGAAYSALTGPGAAGCIKLATHSVLAAAGYPTSVEVTPAPSPPASGAQSAAFTTVLRTLDGRSPLLQGSLTFMAHGSNVIMLSCYTSADATFPPGLLSHLTTTLADRVTSTNPATTEPTGVSRP